MAEQSEPPLVEVTVALKPFLERHQESSVSTIDLLPDRKQTIVENPWSDESLILLVATDDQELISCLNNVMLPERFSAIYHIDTEEIEFIYTAYPVRQELVHTKDRQFSFTYDGKTFECAFKRSSDRLLTIADASRPTAESATGHRNLQSFNTYVRRQRAPQPNIVSSTPIGEPISFWVGKVKFDEEEIVTLARHINFYMSYFDRVTPFIIIHPPKTPDELTALRKERISKEYFPSSIAARKVDEILLQFWNACTSGDSFARFLNAYRILEYCAYFFIEEKQRNAIRRALAAPDALEDLDRIVDKISTTIGLDKLQDHSKIEALFKEYVSPSKLWEEISIYQNTFASESTFDGGFSAPALTKIGWTLSDFETPGLVTVPQALRKVRNALSHGKDQATALCITPTPHNMLRLRPWAELARTAAEEVMIYKKYTV